MPVPARDEHVKNVLHGRPGFTLVEMLVVITIVVVVATFATIFSLRMVGRDGVPKAATEIQGALAQAKNRAIAEGRAHGVRLLITYDQAPYPTAAEAPRPPNRIPVVRQIQFIQDPGDFRDGWVWGTPNLYYPNPGNPDPQGRGEPVDLPVYTPPSSGNPLPGYRYPDVNAPQTAAGWVTKLVPHDPIDATAPLPPPAFTVYGPYGNPPTGLIDWRDDGPNALTRPAQRPNFTFVGYVEPGDLLEIQNNGQLYEIQQAFPPLITGNPSTTLPSRLRLVFNPTQPIPKNGQLLETIRPSRSLNADAAQYSSVASNYRVIRRPRPIPGERPIDLPDKTVIDLSTSDPRPNNPPNFNFSKDASQSIWFRGVSNTNVYTGTINPPFLPPPQTYFDIMFAPTGEVIQATNAREMAGTLYLWVRENPTFPLATMNWYDTANGGASNVDNQALIAIYTRTGAIMTYPVDQASPLDSHTLAETGRGSGGP